MYRVPQSSGRRRPQSQLQSQFAKKGINKRDLPQLLDVNYAQEIINYLIDTDGRLEKRKGITEFFTVAGTNKITMFKKFTDDIFMFAYGTTLASYTISTDTVATLKSNFTAAITDGTKYGDYFFSCNGASGDKIYRTPLATMIPAEIAAAPKCEIVFAFGGRLYAGNTDTDNTQVKWCNIDDGTNPPFSTWTIGTAMTASGAINWRNGGDVQSIGAIGSQVVALFDDGKAGFRITSLDSGGVISQDTAVDFQKNDFGGERGAISTPFGIFYVNENGVFQMVSGGQTNVPYSEQEGRISELLGSDFIRGISFADADIIYVEEKEVVLVTCAQDSSINNLVLAYHPENKAWTTIKGWNISRFMKNGQDIYGADAGKTVAYKIFDSQLDITSPIATSYKQELNVGNWNERKSLDYYYIEGRLGLSSDITIAFDIYDRDGTYVPNKLSNSWTVDDEAGTYDGFNDASWGLSSFGGDIDADGLVDSFSGSSEKIRNFQRILLKISSEDSVDHEINLFSAITTNKGLIRKRNIT